MQEAKTFLAGFLRVHPEELEEALGATTSYRQRKLKKANGGHRVISIPSEPLKKIQRLVLRRILYKIPVSAQLHGYRRNCSIVSSAEVHIGKPYILEVDLKDAFGNVSLEHFQGYCAKFLSAFADLPEWRHNSFREAAHHRYADHTWSANCSKCLIFKEVEEKIRKREIIYPPRLRSEVDRFLKAHRDVFWLNGFRKWLRGEFQFTPDQLELFGYPWFIHYTKDLPEIFEDVLSLLLKLCFYQGRLPQGAPTSGYLLDLAIEFSGVLHQLFKLNWDLRLRQNTDDGIKKESRESGPLWFDLSVYADNFTFSSRYSFNSQLFVNQATVTEKIIKIIEESGLFKVNRDKIRFSNAHKGCPLIIGLSIRQKGVGLTKRRIRWLRSFIHHASHDKKRRAEVRGHFAFLNMIYRHNLPHQLRPKF